MILNVNESSLCFSQTELTELSTNDMQIEINIFICGRGTTGT